MESSGIFTTSGANNRRALFPFRKTQKKHTATSGVAITSDDNNDDDDADIREFRRVYLISRPIPKPSSCDSTLHIFL
jgi:hypothetical protein